LNALKHPSEACLGAFATTQIIVCRIQLNFTGPIDLSYGGANLLAPSVVTGTFKIGAIGDDENVSRTKWAKRGDESSCKFWTIIYNQDHRDIESTAYALRIGSKGHGMLSIDCMNSGFSRAFSSTSFDGRPNASEA
jgi:hypothetical protein